MVIAIGVTVERGDWAAFIEGLSQIEKERRG
jgi:hypothetical protein